MKIRYSLLFAFIAVVGLFANPALAWSECGHHIIARLAYRMMPVAQRDELVRILESHPQFNREFAPPDGIETGSEEYKLWVIGRAGYWPDVARGYPEWNRPKWHYQLGATDSIGIDLESIEEASADVPGDADEDTLNLHVLQAINLNLAIYKSSDRTDAERAVAICWLLHLVADLHQPCHAGSFYADGLFPNGDRGANSIPTKQGRNMHALWDGLLGRAYNRTSIRRRENEIFSSDEIKSKALFFETWQIDNSIIGWKNKSRELGKENVYTPEIRGTIEASRSGGKMPKIELSEAYLSNAGEVAQVQALLAGYRLSNLLSSDIDKTSD